ncbi:MAG: tRNA uridine-5-carboxymethylaminomethyl(34) synthesis GTPase MnmE [bacterium]
MISQQNTDTITAIATAPGEGAIGIIRISGKDSHKIAIEIFRRKNGQQIISPQYFRQYYGFIINSDDKIIDESLLCLMRAPRSYTCEDTVEISIHGSIASQEETLSLILKMGARLAEPGEFTMRAFINGRIDLTQAEAVADIISAKTSVGLRAAQERLSGKLGDNIRRIRGELIQMLSFLEAAIDYSEDDITFLTTSEIKYKLTFIRQEISDLVNSYKSGKILREGAKIAIIGLPNSGKSSLLNYLLGEARAIVTHLPGTTRDTLEEQLIIGGLPVRLVDTAGIRDTDDLAEKIGVEKSISAMNSADIIIAVIDGSIETSLDATTFLKSIPTEKSIIAINKSDLPSNVELTAVKGNIVKISAITGDGIPELEKKLYDLALGSKTDFAGLPNIRTHEAAMKALESIDEAIISLNNSASEDLLSVDITAAAEYLGEITGDNVRDEIISEIFSRFCVGK